MKKIIVLSCVLFSKLILAQIISYNEEFQVNTYVQNDQLNPNVTEISNGGFVVSWDSFSNIDRLWNVSAQIYNQYGEKIGNEITIKTPNGDASIRGNSITSLGDGEFIISYDKEAKGVFAQKYSLTGDIIGNEIEITSNSLIWRSSIAKFAKDGFTICFRKLNQQFEVEGVFCKTFNNNGEILIDEFKVNEINSATEQHPNICSLDNGGYIVSWQSNISGWSKYPVYFKTYDNKGFAVSEEVKVSGMYGEWFSTHQISELDNDKFIIVWDGIDTADDSDYIFAKIFNFDGTNIGQEIPITKKVYNERNPVVKGLSNDEFIVSWDAFRVVDGFDVFGQKFNSDGTKLGKVFQVNTYTTDYQDLPRLGLIGRNKFVIVWSSRGQDDGREYGVFGKYFYSEPIYHELKDFGILSPLNDHILNHANPTFIWNQATCCHKNYPWELTYDLCIDNDESFSNPLEIKGIEDTTYQVDSLQHGQTYHWKVLARNYYGDSLWSSNVSEFYIDSNATDIEEVKTDIPNKFSLSQNYPNPFNPTTIINYTIPTSSVMLNSFQHLNESEIPKEVRDDHVTLKVYNILGKEVATLVNEKKQPGNYNVEFDATNLPSGVYFYRLCASDFTETQKMVLLR